MAIGMGQHHPRIKPAVAENGPRPYEFASSQREKHGASPSLSRICNRGRRQHRSLAQEGWEDAAQVGSGSQNIPLRELAISANRVLLRYERYQGSQMNKLHTCCLPVFFSCLLGATVAAQTIAEGYASEIRALPNGASAPVLLDQGQVYFSGNSLDLDNGKSSRSLLSFANPVFASFTLQLDEGNLLFGESSTGGIWLVPMQQGAAARKLNNVNFNFDAASNGGDWVFISAKTGGFASPNNQIIALNRRTGALDTIAEIPGASGPLCFDQEGNLYYATGSNAFPAPPGATDVLRFAAADLERAFGPTKLAASDASLVFAGLDAAGDMVMDGDHDLLVVDWANNQIVELSDVHRAQPQASILAAYDFSMPGPSSLQYRSGNNHRQTHRERRPRRGAELEAFQPAGGGSLVVFESQFGGSSQLRLLSAQRPTTAVSLGQKLCLQVDDGPKNGQGFLALGLAPWPGTFELGIKLQGFEQRLFWQPSLLFAPIWLPLQFDDQGQAKFCLDRPLLRHPLPVAAQVVFWSGDAQVLGSSSPLKFKLR